MSEADIPRLFGCPVNVGVRLGEPSGWLVDIDLDCSEALTLAPDFLPATGARFGRTSRPASHLLYRLTGPVRTTKFADTEATMMLELRSTGAQTLFPGSVHPSGELILWESNGEPAVVDPVALIDALTHLATATLLARHWSGKGARNEASLAATGFLLRAGLNASRVTAIVTSAARAADDEEWERRGDSVGATAEKLRAGEPITGAPRLAELLRGNGRRVVAQVESWLRVRPETRSSEKPKIDAQDLDLQRVTGAAWKALTAANTPPVVFRRAGILVQVSPNEHGVLVVTPLDADRLRHRLARVARWEKRRPGKDRPTRVPALPPAYVCRDMLVTPEPPMPSLERIVTVPVFTPLGGLLSIAGYDAPTRTIYAPASGLTMPPVPPRPSPADIALARTLIVDELLRDFPFIGDAERAHAVALFLLPFLRELIDGPTPLHLIEKPAPGTGATLLTDVLLRPAIGEAPPIMTEARDEAEWRKRLTAKLIGAPVALVIDNLRRRLDSAAFSAAITATAWEDRLLGESTMVRMRVRCAWAATGNNPVLSGEIARRTVRIRLNARSTLPWQVQGFRHADLRGWVSANRGDLVWAALVLGQAWLTAGRPDAAQTLGGFEAWASVMGGVLDVAGIPGFLQNANELYDASDADGDETRAFLTGWWESFGGAVVKAVELIPAAEVTGLDIEARSPQGRVVRLGKRLASIRDRRYQLAAIVVELRKVGEQSNASRWQLVQVGTGDESGGIDESVSPISLEELFLD